MMNSRRTVHSLVVLVRSFDFYHRMSSIHTDSLLYSFLDLRSNTRTGVELTPLLFKESVFLNSNKVLKHLT